MNCVGTVSKGVVLLPPGTQLEEGAKVRIEPVTPSLTEKPIGQRLAAVDGIAENLPPDLAWNHDYYLHGKPKRPRP